MGPAEPGVEDAGCAEPPATMRVRVVCAVGPQQWLRAEPELPLGATAVQALKASGLAALMPEGLLDTLTLGLWGRACAPDTVLQPGDRVELTRALTVDPKEARRLRYQRDGVRPKRKAPKRAAADPLNTSG